MAYTQTSVLLKFFGPSASFAPIYFWIVYYALSRFNRLFPIAIALGTTRTQLLKTFYGVGILAVLANMVFLNLSNSLLMTLYERGIISLSTWHFGMLTPYANQFFPYLWVDIMIGFFLFGVAFMFYSVLYRLGMTQVLIGIMAIVIVNLLLYVSGGFSSLGTWFGTMNLNPMVAFTLLGLVGLAALFGTYPLMRNARLQPKL